MHSYYIASLQVSQYIFKGTVADEVALYTQFALLLYLRIYLYYIERDSSWRSRTVYPLWRIIKR